MRIILLRHAESLGNVDELAYTRIPDHAIPLTGAGREQARETGSVIRELLRGERPAVYPSPYLRTRETFALLDIEPACDRVTQEPRLREQDWGNLQDRRRAGDPAAAPERLRAFLLPHALRRVGRGRR